MRQTDTFGYLLQYMRLGLADSLSKLNYRTRKWSQNKFHRVYDGGEIVINN